MRSPFVLAAVASTAALFAAGCGGSSYSSGTSAGSGTKSTSAANSSPYGETQSTSTATSTTGSSSTPTGTGVVVVSKHSHDGTILAAGSKRLTVYMFEGDTGSASSCSGACAQVWPPVTTAAAATAAGGAIATDLGTTTRSDGTRQVTYKGHPLYFFVKDKDNGDAYGQGVHGFGSDWYVLKPSGVKVDKS